ncbi:MAG: hypothetical protein AABP62_25245 [Planctomycetota bacterium]
MTVTQVKPLVLKRFTFYSLEFAATPVTTWRGERFRSVLNRMYLPFIRSGWPVPLSFVLDICTLLLNPGTMPSSGARSSTVPPEFRRLTTIYPAVLQRLRQHPVFESMHPLLESLPDSSRQDQAVAAFLNFLVAGASGFESIYTFDTRDLVLEQAAITEQGIKLVTVGSDRKPRTETFPFRGLKPLRDAPETVAAHDVLLMLCEYFETHPLETIITADLRLVLEIAARTRSGKGRVDYRLLSWLLGRSRIEDVESLPPHPRVVQELQPTNMQEVEGQTGGYIDVAKKRFRGSVGEILPAELGLWNHRALTLQKFLNEGVLTYVRENFEYIEHELRVLLCLVIDNSLPMRQAREDAAPELGQGLTPYIRARALAALMLQDLACFLPRENVRVDCGVYLWHPKASTETTGEVSCAGTIDLFSWSPAGAQDRLAFLRGLTAPMPELFYARLTQEDAEARPELEPNPFQYVEHRHRSCHYHCRHIVLLSSSATIDALVDAVPPLGLEASDSGPDSLHLVTCDVNQATLGVARVSAMDYDIGPAGLLHGRSSEHQVRFQFVNTVLRKGAGKPVDDAHDLQWGQFS